MVKYFLKEMFGWLVTTLLGIITIIYTLLDNQPTFLILWIPFTVFSLSMLYCSTSDYLFTKNMYQTKNKNRVNKK